MSPEDSSGFHWLTGLISVSVWECLDKLSHSFTKDRLVLEFDIDGGHFHAQGFVNLLARLCIVQEEKVPPVEQGAFWMKHAHHCRWMRSGETAHSREYR